MHHLLPDETILRIFSHLQAADLARLQSVSSHLRTLAKDRHLWKRLFYFTFVRPPHHPPTSRAPSSTLPTLRDLSSLLLHQYLASRNHSVADGTTPIHRLPRRFYSSPQSQHSVDRAHNLLSSLFVDGSSLHDPSQDHLLDWEQLFCVSTNWQAGNFAVSELVAPEPRPRENAPINHPPCSASSHRHTIVRVANDFIFTAAPFEAQGASTPPSISVYHSEHASAHCRQPELTSQNVPKHLHDRTPITQFTSPALQTFLSTRPSENEAARVQITEIAVDTAVSDASPCINRKRKTAEREQAPLHPVARILVGYSTGHVSVFALQAAQGTIEANEQVFHNPFTATSGDHVAIAALHSPGLVLCSSKFDIAFYHIGSSASAAAQLNLAQRMSSYRCSWPACLRLKRLAYHGVSKRARSSSSCSSSLCALAGQDGDEAAFRVTLAYCTPSYPSSWSICVQELVVRLDLDSNSTCAAHVTSRHATAKHRFTPTPIDLRGRSMLDTDYRACSTQTSSHSLTCGSVPNPDGENTTCSRTTSLTYDDPFVVVGASDNLVEVYELVGATTHVPRDADSTYARVPRSATATPVSQSDALRLVHRRSLHGHTGSVHSVALEDGRCVSGSADGSVMVWSLGNSHPVGTDTRSTTSSTMLEEEQAEEAATHMTHVLTLRTPIEPNHTDPYLASFTPTIQTTHSRNLHPGPSLGQLVRSRILDRQTTGVIRWVSTAFDKIVSIVAYADADAASTRSPNVSVDAPYASERVQVWSFG